ncbi:E3 ubiquitin-protein ligase RHA2B [Linum perenne]
MAPIPTTLVADLYTVAKFFIKLFLLRLTVLLRSDKSRKLLDFVNDNYPPTHYYSAAAAAECSVCLADFAKGDAVRKLRCGHCFHRSCVDRWFEELVMTCPLCRSGVVSPPGGGGERRLREEEDDRQEWGQRQLVVLLSSLRGDDINNN